MSSCPKWTHRGGGGGGNEKIEKMTPARVSHHHQLISPLNYVALLPSTRKGHSSDPYSLL